MFAKRKLSSKILLGAILTTICCAVYLVYFRREPHEYRSNLYKLGVIEDGISSKENRFQCVLPDLPLNSSEMLSFLKDEPPIRCDDVEPWVFCGSDPNQSWLCRIRNEIIDRFGPISCDFSEIIRSKDDSTFTKSQRVRSKTTFELINSDFVSVKCWTDEYLNRNYWNGLLTGIRKANGLVHGKIRKLPFNVVMYGFDSLSRNAFIRKLPKTYEYMVTHLKADVLQGYNIVGDGTPQALIPLLTGFTELELPETRRRIKSSNFVNVYPFLFYEYEKSGYVTTFNEDLPNVGTFSYRLNGFNDQPTTHYMRPFYLALQQELHRHKRLCVGDTPRHTVMLDYTEQIMQTYENKKPLFAFSFHGELSHDSINLIGNADNDVTEWLQNLQRNGLLDNTILILMSDHGNRFAEVRNTLQGKLEERLPFFSFIFPDKFKKRFPKQYTNFRENLNRLVTPFDIHKTLLDILGTQNIENPLKQKSHKNAATDELLDKNDNGTVLRVHARKLNRALSLLRPIPENRTCAEAYIEPHWCSCLSLNFVNATEALVKRAAHAVVNLINEYTKNERHLCHELQLANITWAGTLEYRQNLLKFKTNRDLDGYLADLSATTSKSATHLYQIQLFTSPGNSLFEASLTHNSLTDQFSIDMAHISRINEYGSQAACILEKNPDLRKFCFCRCTINCKI